MLTDDLPVGRVLSRREMIGLIGAAGATLLGSCLGIPLPNEAASDVIRSRGSRIVWSKAAAAAVPPLHVIATPQETEGPFFIDERLNRDDLTSQTSDRDTLNGLPLLLNINVYEILPNGSARPLPGARVDVWHSNTQGVYSGEPSQPMQPHDTRWQTFLRGYQMTGRDGAVHFQTVYPGWYAGRTVHIHFKVRLLSDDGHTQPELTSQLYMDDEVTSTVMASEPYNRRGERPVRNADDMVFNTPDDDGQPSGKSLILDLARAGLSRGYAGRFNIGLKMS